ncbi:MAG: NAD-dependent malic enzyme, partial [Planctomycetales bacterium]|nr:NAD-dependent malic enzyme [Planctomycetales bacterium]
HDDQHGTAIVVLAGLKNAMRLVQKNLADVRIVINGAGAAGTAVARLLINAGAGDIVVCDSRGAINKSRTDLGNNSIKIWLSENTNQRGESGTLSEVIRGKEVFVGVSVADVLNESDVASMADDAIVFALANPNPEIDPSVAEKHVRIMATGRSDYSNQINNVLCFPGLFRGVLDVRARCINDEMKLAAADAIAGVIAPENLTNHYVIPSVFDRRVCGEVAKAVAQSALETGVARRRTKQAYQVS